MAMALTLLAFVFIFLFIHFLSLFLFLLFRLPLHFPLPFFHFFFFFIPLPTPPPSAINIDNVNRNRYYSGKSDGYINQVCISANVMILLITITNKQFDHFQKKVLWSSFLKKKNHRLHEYALLKTQTHLSVFKRTSRQLSFGSRVDIQISPPHPHHYMPDLAAADENGKVTPTSI